MADRHATWTMEDVAARFEEAATTGRRLPPVRVQDIDHPAVFPVALPQFVIDAYSDEGDLVFEPFGGSGTTMLAAQRTGRICRTVEIAPEYVDVAIRRFQQNHPDVPVTLLATGRSFDEVAAERLAATEVAA